MHDHDHPHDHSHGHSHDHDDHDHTHHHEVIEIRAQPVILDLGDGIGALIVHTDPELLGLEIDISPASDDAERQHKQVLQRTIGPETVTVLVYDNLREGEYTLWFNDAEPTRGVQVTSGAVAKLDLRGTTRLAAPVSRS